MQCIESDFKPKSIKSMQALKKANMSDERPDDYVIVEEVNKSWEKHDTERGGEQRILFMDESILAAQNRWKGSGKFMLRKKGNVSKTML